MKKSDQFFSFIECDEPRKTIFRLSEVFWHLLWSLKIISVTTKRLLKTQIFEKMAVSPMKKKRVTIFSRFIECDIPQETIFSLLEVFWLLLWSYKIICLAPKRILKTQSFKKKAIFPVKKIFNHLFSIYRAWEASRNFLDLSTRYSDNHWATYKIISATPMRLLKTQISEKKSDVSH